MVTLRRRLPAGKPAAATPHTAKSGSYPGKAKPATGGGSKKSPASGGCQALPAPAPTGRSSHGGSCEDALPPKRQVPAQHDPCAKTVARTKNQSEAAQATAAVPKRHGHEKNGSR